MLRNSAQVVVVVLLLVTAATAIRVTTDTVETNTNLPAPSSCKVNNTLPPIVNASIFFNQTFNQQTNGLLTQYLLNLSQVPKQMTPPNDGSWEELQNIYDNATALRSMIPEILENLTSPIPSMLKALAEIEKIGLSLQSQLGPNKNQSIPKATMLRAQATINATIQAFQNLPVYNGTELATAKLQAETIAYWSQVLLHDFETGNHGPNSYRDQIAFYSKITAWNTSAPYAQNMTKKEYLDHLEDEWARFNRTQPINQPIVERLTSQFMITELGYLEGLFFTAFDDFQTVARKRWGKSALPFLQSLEIQILLRAIKQPQLELSNALSGLCKFVYQW